MKVLSFHSSRGVLLGVSVGPDVVDVTTSAAAMGITAPRSIRELIISGEQGLLRLKEIVDSDYVSFPIGQVRFAPAVPDAQKVICVGLNYRKHSHETGIPVPSRPIYFGKYQNSLAGHGQEVAIPTNAKEIDYEVELVVVIGRRARNVMPGEAADYIFGYATGNDLSARDLQNRSSQWMYGKAIDAFAPVGPYVVTKDEIPDSQGLQLGCWINGVQRQMSNTSHMIFGAHELVSDLSEIMTLEPGEVIFTGTPEGVILGTQEPVWLGPGDEVACEIAGLGRLVNVLVEHPG